MPKPKKKPNDDPEKDLAISMEDDPEMLGNLQGDLGEVPIGDEEETPGEEPSKEEKPDDVSKIKEEYELFDRNVVKVIMDRKGFAMYFSRSVIPYKPRSTNNGHRIKNHYKHIGLYAYTKDFLFTFKSLPQSPLEKVEKLEQLRVLENGYKIKVVETKFDTVGIDTPEDLVKAMELIKGSKQLSFL